MLERDIQHAIRLALGRERDLVLWRNSAGVFDTFDEHTAQVRKTKTGLITGASDLIGILKPTGRWVALEIKTATGKVSDDQERFIRLIRSMGGFAAVVRSVEEARAALVRARAGANE